MVSKKQSSYGFTIVELLVVIVVIGILAAITIVSYSGITNRATISSLQSDLTNASTTLKLDYTSNGTFPATLALANGGKGITQSQSLDNIIYIPDNTSNPNNFCLQYRKGNNNYAVDNTSAVTSGVCLQNLVTNGDFRNGTSGWGAQTNASINVINNECFLLGTQSYGALVQSTTPINGHVYYYSAWVKSTSNLVRLSYLSQSVYHSGNNTYTRLSIMGVGNGVATYFYVIDTRVSGWDNVAIKNVLAADLTATFGAGNEPTQAQMDAIMNNYPNSWFNIVAKASL